VRFHRYQWINDRRVGGDILRAVSETLVELRRSGAMITEKH
jgi:hypothetical protein